MRRIMPIGPAASVAASLGCAAVQSALGPRLWYSRRMPAGKSHPPSDAERRLAAFFASASQPGVVSAYLFGSHAAGRAHRESDVDVGVLLDWTVYPDAASRFDARVVLAAELPALLGSSADVVILNDAPPGLGRQIVTGGVRVCLRAAALDHAFVRDVQLRAADLDPWLRRMRTIKLQAIAP